MKRLFCILPLLILSCYTIAQQESLNSVRDSLLTILQRPPKTLNDSIAHMQAWNQLGVSHYTQGRIQEAIEYTGKAIDIWKYWDEMRRTYYSVIPSNQALYYRSSEKYHKALELDSIIVVLRHSLGEDSPDYARSLNDLGVDYYGIGNLKRAIECQKKALPYLDETSYLIGLKNLCHYYREAGNYEMALKMDSIHVKIKHSLGEEDPDYGIALNDLGVDYIYLENYTKAIECIEKALPYLVDKAYCSGLQNISMAYKKTGNIAKAVQYGEAVLSELREKGITSLITLSNVALLYAKKGDYQQAIQLAEQSIKDIDKQGKNTSIYGVLLNNLALIKSETGDYQGALKLYQESAGISLKITGEKHTDYITTLNNIADMYMITGDKVKALSYLTKAEKIQKEINPKHSIYITILNNLALYYSKIDNLEKAIEIETKVLSLQKELTGETHPDYALGLNNLANFYSLIGNKDKASELTRKAMSIQEQAYGKNNILYATLLHNLSDYEWNIKPETAILHITESISIIEKSIGKKNKDYINAFYKLINFASRIKNDTLTIKGGYALCMLTKEVMGVKNSIYSGTLDLMATSSLRLKKDKDAYKLDSMAVKLEKDLNGTKHDAYIRAIHNFAFICHKTRRKSLSDKYRQECLYELKDYIRRNFSYLTNAEREKWWKQISYQMVQFPYYAYMDNDSLSCALAYDATLLSNGILLNTNIEFDKFMQQEADETLLLKYNGIREQRMMLDKLYQIPLEKRTIHTDSLEKVIFQSEKELLKQSKVLGDFTKNLTLSWKDVQSQLSTEDLAIEFTGFSSDSLGVQYTALLLRKNWKCPRMFYLFEEKELTAVKKNDYYISPDLYQLVWKPLEKELEGVKNIFFTPVAKLHQIAIEYLPLPDQTNIAQKYNIYRLSSTRELTKQQNRQFRISKAVLYGGLEYEIGQVDWAQIRKQVNGNSVNSQVFRDIPSLDSLNIRSGLNYLEGTEVEVQNIQKELNKLNISTDMFTGINGTEDSFKHLSGQNVNTLHIATHGFYQPEEQAQTNQSFVSVSDLENNNLSSKEDRSLSRSGLLFSGAASTLNGENIPNDLDDGILTAKELSRLNLQTLEIVVLSACQTGIGDITDEGVYGIQRGFKKAGAQTLIMSLWKVNDTATQIWMSEFYKNLVSGKSKRKAFLDAQQYLRTCQNGKYNKPEYWAAFIMLDGID